MNVPARVSLATLMLNQDKFEDAGREYEAACQSPFAGGAVHAQLIRLRLHQLTMSGGTPAEWGRLDQLITRSVGRFSSVDSEPVVLRAEAAAAQGKRDEALQRLRAEVGRRPGDVRLWTVLAAAAADHGGTAAGLAVVDEAQAAVGDTPDVRLCRADLFARDPARVRSLDPLGGRIEAWPDVDQARLLAGLIEVYDRLGNKAAVVETLRRMTGRRPADAALWKQLAVRANGLPTDGGKAAAEARAALARIEGEGGASVLLADALASSGDAILQRFASAFGRDPNSAEACLALARVHHARGDESQAMRLTERAVVLEPSRFETNEAFLLQLQRAGGTDRLGHELARLTGDPRWRGEPLRRLIGNVAAQLPKADAPALLRRCPASLRRGSDAIGWWAEALARFGDAAQPSGLLTEAVAAAGATADDWLRLALYHAGRNDPAALRATFETARGRLSEPAFYGLAATFGETAHAKLWQPETATPAARRALVQARLAVKMSRSLPADAVGLLEAFLTEPGQPATDLAWAKRNLAMLLVLGGRGPADRQRPDADRGDPRRPGGQAGRPPGHGVGPDHARALPRGRGPEEGAGLRRGRPPPGVPGDRFAAGRVQPRPALPGRGPARGEPRVPQPAATGGPGQPVLPRGGAGGVDRDEGLRRRGHVRRAAADAARRGVPRGGGGGAVRGPGRAARAGPDAGRGLHPPGRPHGRRLPDSVRPRGRAVGRIVPLLGRPRHARGGADDGLGRRALHHARPGEAGGGGRDRRPSGGPRPGGRGVRQDRPVGPLPRAAGARLGRPGRAAGRRGGRTAVRDRRQVDRGMPPGR